MTNKSRLTWLQNKTPTNYGTSIKQHQFRLQHYGYQVKDSLMKCLQTVSLVGYAHVDHLCRQNP
ncbi:MAG: hypothetical protein ACK56F_28230, partial [bacterium]